MNEKCKEKLRSKRRQDQQSPLSKPQQKAPFRFDLFGAWRGWCELMDELHRELADLNEALKGLPKAQL